MPHFRELRAFIWTCNLLTIFSQPAQDMEGTQKVWVPDQVHGFVLASIVDLTSDGVQVQPVTRGSKPITADYDRIYPAEEDENKDVDDNCEYSREHFTSLDNS